MNKKRNLLLQVLIMGLVVLIILPFVSAVNNGNINIAIVDAKFLATPTAHSLADVMVTVKNTGDAAVDVYTEIYERLDEGQKMRMYDGCKHIVKEEVEAVVEELPVEESEKASVINEVPIEEQPCMDDVEVISSDGTKRAEKLVMQSVDYYVEPYRNELIKTETGEVIHVDEDGGKTYNEIKPVVKLNHGDSIELSYVTDILKTSDSGMHTVEFTLKTNEIGDANPEDNVYNLNVDVAKREPLVVTGPVAENREKNYPALKNGEYWVYDYWEYNNVDGNLCTNIENKEVCFIRKFDGVNYPFSVDGQLKKIGFFAKLFHLFSTESESYLHGVFGGYVSFTINGVKIYYMDTGFKVKP